MKNPPRHIPTAFRFSTWAPVLCALAVLSALSVLFGASATASDSENETATRARQLVEIHCIRCHDAPDPHDLSKDVWPKRLAEMGMYLGFKGDEFPDIVSVSGEVETPFVQLHVVDAVGADGSKFNLSAYERYLIASPVISLEDWISIRDYFVENSLTLDEMVLPVPDHPVIKGFEAKVPNLDVEPNGLIISTRVDEAKDILYVGRGNGRQMFAMKEGVQEDLLALDLKSGKRLARKELTSDPSHIELTDVGIRFANHGEFPPERGNGQSFITDLVGFASGDKTEHMLVYGRHRIINLHTLDMNGDGLDDIVTNSFGDGINNDFGGGLTILWQLPGYASIWPNAPAKIPAGALEGALRDEVLLDHVGGISSSVADLDNDGDPDIALLLAQGHQQVIVYWNSGGGKFQKQILERYSPAFGGNTIYAKDVDADGNIDLIFLNGDNVTNNFVGGQINKPKPYHGVRVLRNQGGQTFDQAYFYPMHGATRAAIEDFDGDGDQDIAAISMYPDWRWDMPESFVYLENTGDFQFRPASIARENFGIWLSVEAADVNNDDKPDIVLGLGDWPKFVPDDWMKRDIMKGRPEAPSILFLLNQN